MTRTRWWAAGLIGIIVIGLVAVGLKHRAASQPSLAATLSGTAASVETLSQAAATATSTVTSVTQAAAAAATPASAAMPATAGEIGGPAQIQTALANAGFYSGPVDGKIGPMTQQSIKNFQSAHGLTADGRVGTKTWDALKAFLSSQQQPAQPPSQ